MLINKQKVYEMNPFKTQKNNLVLLIKVAYIIIIIIGTNLENTVVLAESNDRTDFEFETAEISFDLKTNNGIINYKGYKQSTNNLILKEKDIYKVNKLIWISLGNPELVRFHKGNKTTFINFNSAGFNIHIKTLTEEDKINFVEWIKEFKGINITTKQILSLVPSSLTCSTEIDMDNNKYKVVYGKAKDLNRSPFRVDFDVRKGTMEHLVIEKKLQDENPYFSFDCIFQLYRKPSKLNYLVISSEEWTKDDIKDKLFGKAEYVYITRDQLDELTSKIHTSLNIFEHFEIPEYKFADSFIEGLIYNYGDKQISHVAFDEAIKHLSSFGFEKEEFKPDQIKKDLSNLFKIEQVNSRKQIIFNRYHFEHLITNGRSNKEIASILDSNLASKYFQEMESLSSIKNNSLQEQLKQLNAFTKDHILWEIQGDKIIPKSINVTKLIKSKFSKKHVFHRINKQSFEILFEKKITLYTDEPLEHWDRDETFRKIKDQMNTNEKKSNFLTNENVNSKNEQVRIHSSFVTPTQAIFTWRLCGTLKEHNDDDITTLTVLPNGYLASGTSQKTIKIWDINEGTVKMRLAAHTFPVISLAVLPNGDLASGSYDNRIYIWDMKDGTKKMTLIGNHSDGISSLAVFPNGDIASGSFDNTIIIWDMKKGLLKKILYGHTDCVKSLAVLSNGDLASGSYDQSIKIWNINDGSVKRTLTGHSDMVTSLAILPNGDLASGSDDQSIKIWNINDGRLKRTLTGHSHYVTSLAVLPNGDLASGSFDDRIIIWSVNDGFKSRPLDEQSGIISLVAFPNGDLATCAIDKNIRIWKKNMVVV